MATYTTIAVLTFHGSKASTAFELGYLRASDDPRNLTSPNFPDPYPSNASNIWWIYSSYLYSEYYLQFFYLDIEDSNNCENDNLTIYQYHGELEKIVQVCGNTTTQQKLELGSDVIVIFKTNNNTEGKGFVLQYYVVENDDSRDRDGHRSEGYTSNWGTAVIVVFALTATVLIAAIALACYCQRKQKQSNVQEINFSSVAVVGDHVKPGQDVADQEKAHSEPV